jgi:hypothetical protein
VIKRAGSASVALLLLAAILSAVANAQPQPSPWARTGDLPIGRILGFTMVTLQDGRVLGFGGRDFTNDGTYPQSTLDGGTPGYPDRLALLWDPATGTWQRTGRLLAGRGESSSGNRGTATLLDDGRVFVTGGFTCCGAPSLWWTNETEFYDPSSGTFSSGPPAPQVHGQSTGTKLSDGRVLIIGYAGDSPDHSAPPYMAADIFDPHTNSWTTATPPPLPLVGFGSSTLLPDGRLLVLRGGGGGNARAVLYDPAHNSWSTPTTAPVNALAPAALLGNGKVLVPGFDASGLFDPVSDTWSVIDGDHLSAQPRSAVTLQDGRAFLVGTTYLDDGAGAPVGQALVFDPATNRWHVSEMTQTDPPDIDTALTVLNDGRVLVAGGDRICDHACSWTATALYDPSVPFVEPDTTPPVVTGAPDRAPNSNGWYNAPVTINWSVTDPDPSSGTPTTPSATVASTDGRSVAYASGPSCDPAGNCGTGSVTLSIDRTPPTVGFTGAQPSYTVDQNISIGCVANDALSGVDIAATNCPTMSTPAYKLTLGSHTVQATVTDLAGNTTTSSVTFTVVDSPAALTNLVNQFVTQPGIANALGAKLRAGQINAFINQVHAQTGKSITSDQAAILIALASAL